jgi:hypothetical protein
MLNGKIKKNQFKIKGNKLFFYSTRINPLTLRKRKAKKKKHKYQFPINQTLLKDDI